MNLPEKANLEKIYGESSACAARFQNLADNFTRIYKHDHADFFTSPGRTEIIGNHVDHNGGKVIAGSINLDTIGAAAPNGTNVIRAQMIRNTWIAIVAFRFLTYHHLRFLNKPTFSEVSSEQS